MRSRTTVWLVVGLAGLIIGVASPARAHPATAEAVAGAPRLRAAQTAPPDADKSPALCAPGDPNPEPGIQGDVPAGQDPQWDCGVRSIGLLPDAGGAMAVAGTCAYTGSGLGTGMGVRVIDVSDPTTPNLVRVLETSSRELLAARVANDRAILATRHRDTQPDDGQVLGRDMLIDIWDIRVCTDPQKLGTLRFPTTSDFVGDPPGETGGPGHNLTLNPTATKVYGTLPVQEGDITDLAHPENWTVRDLDCPLANQYHEPYMAAPGLCESVRGSVAGTGPQIGHEAKFNPDGSRLYLGGQIPNPNSNNMWIVDMTGQDPRVISVTEQTPGHSIDFATINGRHYLLHSNEIGGAACIPEAQRPRYVGMGDRAWLLDITDETAPTQVSEIVLKDSTFDHCGPQNVGGPSTAYHDVDDPLDTRYAVIGFGSAGFRFFDIRDPANPVEVAYFNHGSSAHTKPYIIPATGHIWVSDESGFRVLELEPQVRQHLGLDGSSAEASAPTTAVAAPAEPEGSLPATGRSSPDAATAAGVAAMVAGLAAAVVLRRSRRSPS